MGKQERASRERSKRNQLRKTILSVINAAGALHPGIMRRNVVGAMEETGMIPSSRQDSVVDRTVLRLVEIGLLAWQERKLRLTQKGERALRHFTMKEYSLKKPRKWDGKWRVLIFDIPERRKGLRAKLRSALQAIGFVRLQNSVWVYPYDCEDLITLLKADFYVGDDILYLIVDSIERDNELRKQFKLG